MGVITVVTFAFLLALRFVPAMWPENGIDPSDHYGLLPIIITAFAVCRALTAARSLLSTTPFSSNASSRMKAAPAR